MPVMRVRVQTSKTHRKCQAEMVAACNSSLEEQETGYAQSKLSRMTSRIVDW